MLSLNLSSIFLWKSHSELPIQDGEWGEGRGRVAAGMFVQ